MFNYRLMRHKVVVLKEKRPVGTIKRHKFHGGVVVSVPGLLSPSTTPGRANYASVDEAKLAIEREASCGEARWRTNPKQLRR